MSKTNQAPPSAHILEAMLEVWTQAGGEHLIPITGCSMLPLIRDGDEVLVRHGWADVRRGDVVVFWRQGTLIAHRVMRIQRSKAGQLFVTRGDNVLHFDSPVNANEVVGRVLAVKRGERLMSLDTPLWRITGWLIVVGTLPSARLYTWGRNLKHRLWGPKPHPLTALLRRSVLASFSFVLKMLQMIASK